MNFFGRLYFHITSARTGWPIENATIKIYDTMNPSFVLETIMTNSIGQTKTLELHAPTIEYSMKPYTNQPYSTYIFEITADGYESIRINNAQILCGETAIQDVTLTPHNLLNLSESNFFNTFNIDPHTLFSEYQAKIAEDEIKLLNDNGTIISSNVVIPSTIIVHNGTPNDTSAKNYTVKYKDYIKNVASNEIYSTWPITSIQANVLAILSFTLNRVYTEWYRNQGYDFTITSSAAYDQKWVPNKAIYEKISHIVDELFTCYLSRPNVLQPIFTQYADGKRVHSPNWMSKWDSYLLGYKGCSPLEILREYYGESISINSSEKVSGIHSIYPYTIIKEGARSEKVRHVQQQLNVITHAYPNIQSVIPNGIYGKNTADAVYKLQKILHLPQTGTVDFSTWHKISELANVLHYSLQDSGNK